MEKQYVILNCGSGYCRAGFSGDSKPKLIQPTVVGHLKSDPENDLLFGKEAIDKDNNLYEIKHPIHKGVIENWDDYEKYTKNILTKGLKIKIEEHGIFLTEPCLATKKDREKIAEIFFEKFNAPSIFITNGAVLSLYGACKYSGFVVDCGYECTSIVPISNGYPFKNSIKTLDIGGETISNYLMKLINNKNKDINTDNLKKCIDELKEKLCYLSIKNNKEDEINSNTNLKSFFKLPDDSQIELSEERFLAPEILYHPELIGKEVGGLGNMFCSSMANIDRLTKKQFDGTVVLAGGSSLIPNFEERFKSELKNFYGGKYKDRVNIVSVRERKLIEWIGGNIYSLMQIFSGLCTTKKEYDECGKQVVHNKCFY